MAAKFEHGLYPGRQCSAVRTGKILVFGLYFTMTGLHALHVIIGMVSSRCSSRSSRGGKRRRKVGALENGGLYWHLVDIIWIFLFPLFYLIS